MSDLNHYLQSNFDTSRQIFRQHLDKIRKKWPEASLNTTSIGREKDNTIDTLFAEALSTNHQVLFLTSGLHGIEGYPGAAAIHLFVEEYLDHIDPSTTGVCLVHGLNPWGMRNNRRVTENNVDLNRNCFYDPGPVGSGSNKKYREIGYLFTANGKLKSIFFEKARLYGKLVAALIKHGSSSIKKAKKIGQFEYPKGIYYGGTSEEESTSYIKHLQNKMLSSFARVIHIDWHSGLGPTGEVTLVISEQDPRSEEEVKEQYQVKNVMLFSPDEVKGDSTHHFYELRDHKFSERYLFSALCEFGTYGSSNKALLRELVTMVLENQLYWQGTEKESNRQWVLDEFQKMFYPQDLAWQQAVLKNARYALKHVLTREGFLSSGQ